MSQPKDWTPEYAERMRLVGTGGTCQHPVEFRHPLLWRRHRDPNEWECGVCDMWQVKDERT